jgi:hypothetical protein
LLLLSLIMYINAAVASASTKDRNPWLDPFDDGPDEEFNYQGVFAGGKQEEDPWSEPAEYTHNWYEVAAVEQNKGW